MVLSFLIRIPLNLEKAFDLRFGLESKGFMVSSQLRQISNKEKGRKSRYRPLTSSKKSEWSLLPSDEPFNVLLRTSATNHMSNNGLHGGTSISWTSPPLINIILSSLPPSCQEEIKE